MASEKLSKLDLELLIARVANARIAIRNARSRDALVKAVADDIEAMNALEAMNHRLKCEREARG